MVETKDKIYTTQQICQIVNESNGAEYWMVFIFGQGSRSRLLVSSTVT